MYRNSYFLVVHISLKFVFRFQNVFSVFLGMYRNSYFLVVHISLKFVFLSQLLTPVLSKFVSKFLYYQFDLKSVQGFFLLSDFFSFFFSFLSFFLFSVFC